jgi:hypothetical protein
MRLPTHPWKRRNVARRTEDAFRVLASKIRTKRVLDRVLNSYPEDQRAAVGEALFPYLKIGKVAARPPEVPSCPTP